MKTFMYNWSKEKEYNQTPSDLYRKKFTYIDTRMRHAWRKNTEYKRGDVVFDYIETKKFFILFFDGTSSNVDTIYDDELEWTEYNAMTEKLVTNFTEILLQSDISKYREDDKYYDIYNVPTNIKIEQLAYDYYDNVDYWDIILVLNNMTNYLKLPQSNDIIITNTLKKLKKWGSYFDYTEEDFEYLDSYLSTHIWGINKDIRTTFIDENAEGVYYLNKGDLIQVNSYHTRQNVLFHYKNLQPIQTELTFNNVFPLTLGDVISLKIRDTNIIHNVTSDVDTQNLNTNFNSLLPHFDSILIATNIFGLSHTVDSTPGSEKITFINDTRKIQSYSINDTSTRNDVLNIKVKKDMTIQEAVDAGYLVEVDDNFIPIDYTDTETLHHYDTLLKMYNKYFEEMNTENNKYQFIKILKPEFINEFRQDYLEKRNKVKNISTEDI
jgi:hypothetical protein